MQTILKISLIFIAVMLVLYIVFSYLDLEAVYVNDILNNSTLGVEGFVNGSPSDVPKLASDVKTLTNKIEDTLQVTKYRKDYEDLIIKSDELFELLKLDALADMKNVKMEDDKRIVESAEKIRLFEEARKSLESALNYIDTK